jgi:hypothetical protein
MMQIGYARVSTQDQDAASQIAALKNFGCELIFQEKVSGGRWDRPELHRMLGQLRKGDVVVVWKLDRLSRSLKDVLTLMEKIAQAVRHSSIYRFAFTATGCQGITYMSKRGKGMQGEIGTFLREYQRKAQRHVEPNDRQYDRNVEKKIKSIDPRRLSELMHDDVGFEVPREVEDRWYASDRIEGVDFYINDAVSITDGSHSGEGGAVISLLRLKPEPEYIVELGSGDGDIKVFQSRLRRLPT